MAKYDFAAELANYGPEAAALARPMTAGKGRRYCRRLARLHYENFTVVSLLLPAPLRQHFYNVYAYCRWADDLADEPGDPQRSLALLDWWELQLRRCFGGESAHPVFAALSETIRRFNIPIDPFVDLLVAFRQDQRTPRYETMLELLDYCRYSANPVGRLVLYMGECFDPIRARLADAICTGLQLVNFLQDVALDWQRGRIYLPQADCRRFGYDEAMFARQEYNEAFRRLMAAEADEAAGWLHRGRPLVDQTPPSLRFDVALFIEGGLAAIEALRRCEYNVWSARPTLSRWEKARLAAQCWWRLRRQKRPEAAV